MIEKKQIEEMAKIIGIPCYKRIEAYGDGSQECPSPIPCNECTAELLYKAGYRKQSEGEWISVEERLPDRNGVFLVALKESGYENLVYFDVRPYADGEWRNLPDKLTVSHWMPIPNPPKGE